MLEVKRKKSESFEGFMRRVKRTWQRSGKIQQVKKIQFHLPAKSRNQRRKHAVKRARLTAKRDFLIKTGQLNPDDERTA